MSLRFIPENSHPTQVNSLSFTGGEGAPSVPSLPDTLRQGGPISLASQLNGKHPLESRLDKWQETQESFKMESYRRAFGSGEPIRRAMELEIIKSTDFVPKVLGTPSNIHHDILTNKDCTIDWEDVYPGLESEGGLQVDFHGELEKRMRI